MTESLCKLRKMKKPKIPARPETLHDEDCDHPCQLHGIASRQQRSNALDAFSTTQTSLNFAPPIIAAASIDFDNIISRARNVLFCELSPAVITLLVL